MWQTLNYLGVPGKFSFAADRQKNSGLCGATTGWGLPTQLLPGGLHNYVDGGEEEG